MQVFGRGLILAALRAFAPPDSSAAPRDRPLFGAGAIEGEFLFHNDVARFSCTLAGETLFSARTTSVATAGFDDTFGVFRAYGNVATAVS